MFENLLRIFIFIAIFRSQFDDDLKMENLFKTIEPNDWIMVRKFSSYKITAYANNNDLVMIHQTKWKIFFIRGWIWSLSMESMW